MGQSTAEVRHDIERTRDQMSGTIDAIADRTSPRRVVGRQRRRVSERVHHLRVSVMGSAEDAYDTTQQRARDLADNAEERLHAMAEDVRDAPDALKRQTQGSPLAAGLIAFGAGALAAAVFPSTRVERQAASRLESRAEPAVAQLKEAGHEVAQEMKESAREAVESVKSKAGESARELSEDVKSATEQVQADVKSTTSRPRNPSP